MFNPLQPEIRSIFWPVEDSGGRIVVGRAPSAEYTGSADYRSCEYGRLDHRVAQLSRLLPKIDKESIAPPPTNPRVATLIFTPGRKADRRATKQACSVAPVVNT